MEVNPQIGVEMGNSSGLRISKETYFNSNASRPDLAETTTLLRAEIAGETDSYSKLLDKLAVREKLDSEQATRAQNSAAEYLISKIMEASIQRRTETEPVVLDPDTLPNLYSAIYEIVSAEEKERMTKSLGKESQDVLGYRWALTSVIDIFSKGDEQEKEKMWTTLFSYYKEKCNPSSDHIITIYGEESDNSVLSYEAGGIETVVPLIPETYSKDHNIKGKVEYRRDLDIDLKTGSVILGQYHEFQFDIESLSGKNINKGYLEDTIDKILGK